MAEDSPQQDSLANLNSRYRLAWAAVSVLALLPLILVVILGSHGRMMGDDFCHLVSGLEYGPWGNLLFWRDSLNGSFSYYFLHGLIAPLDVHAASLFVIIVVVVWLVGLVWLIAAGHRLFGRARPPLAIVIAVAAALVWLSIHGLVTQLSIYYYSAITRHTLPVTIFVLILAACCEIISRAKSSRQLAVACAVIALVTFLNTGMSEVFGTVQLALFTVMLPAIYKLVPRESQRNSLALGMSGWAANVAALGVMATAPGVVNRLMRFRATVDSPIGVHVDRIPETLKHIQAFIIDKELATAFVGALAISLFAMLSFRRPACSSPIGKPFQLTAPPIWLCLIVQLLLLPVVWGHQSDNPLVFGRFNPAHMLVIGAQAILIASLAAICLARQKINDYLRKNPSYCTAVPALTLGAVFSLYGALQVESVSWHTATYASSSLHTLLFALLWQVHSHFRATGIKSRFFAGYLWGFAVMGLSTLALLLLNQAIVGRLSAYNLSFISFAFAGTGFICGFALAYAIRQVNATAAPSNHATLTILYGSAIVAAAIWFGIVIGNTSNISEFERFSRAWDERHQLILAKRDAGERLEKSPRLADEILAIPGGFWGHDYWGSFCASDEITALIKKRYRA